MKTKISENNRFFLFFNKNLKPISIFALLLSLVANIVYFQYRESSMSPNWTAPYYSAAANLKLNGSFDVSVKDVTQFKNLDNLKKEDKYKFSKDSNLVHYNHNPIGFSYVIWFASKLFPFLGHQQALIALQILVHLIICTFFLFKKDVPNLFKLLLIFTFLFNPIVIKFTTFNFYYFWQLIPVFLIVLYLLKVKIPSVFLWILVLIMGFVFAFRPTTLLSILFSIFLILKNETKVVWMISLLVFCLPICFTLKETQKNFFHTSYVGIGAYDNPWGIRLSDDDGYKLYEQEYGESLNASFGGNYYEKETTKKYKDVTKKKYFEFLKEKPLLFIRNAILNTFQGFSFGYMNGAPSIYNYIIALLGLIHVFILIYLRKWIVLGLILSITSTIVLYYPPIPAYVYGIYLALVFSIYSILIAVRERARLKLNRSSCDRQVI